MKLAIVCIAKNEDNYIEEWINYHLKLGFDNIFIYENDWRCSIENEKIIKIPFDGINKQLWAYIDFNTRFKQEYDWALFIDCDEFLVLKKHNNVHEFINDYKDYNSIALSWVLFGDNGDDGENITNYSVLERFTKRQIGTNLHIKSFVKLNQDFIFSENPHAPYKDGKWLEWVDTNYVKGGGASNGIGVSNAGGPDDVAYLNHYYCKTRKEFEQKIKKGRADFFGYVRTFSDFNLYNLNEIEDYTALNFFKKVI